MFAESIWIIFRLMDPSSTKLKQFRFISGATPARRFDLPPVDGEVDVVLFWCRGRLPEEGPEEGDAHGGAPYLGCRRPRLTLRIHPRWRSLSVAHGYWSSDVNNSNDISNPNLLYRYVLFCLMYFNFTHHHFGNISTTWKQFNFTKAYLR